MSGRQLALFDATPWATVAAARECPRCKRTAAGWPLKRADLCSPEGWRLCLRNPQPEWTIASN